MIPINTINYCSISAGPGIRTEVFVQGCPHNCPGCFSTDTHDMNGGTLMSVDQLFDAIEAGENPYLTICGGEPLLYIAELLNVCIRHRDKHPDAHIIIYSGYSHNVVSQLLSNTLLPHVDGLVLGSYIQEQNCMSHPRDFIGSENQTYLYVHGNLRVPIPATRANAISRDENEWIKLGVGGQS